ncbi:MAG: dihydrolipoyllysine-residue acetyltransferase, partial [Gammaproteobacteria bacterium]|nr:dihydrolipoyllysine-residue acetyltransferase [Gammaproteobacteria bacterium]
MDISVPDLGDFADVEIIEVLVKVGDRIEPEDPLVTLETDKATMDVPSTAAGSVVEIKVAVGDRVSTGDVIVVLDGDGAGDGPAAGGSEAAGEASEAGPAAREPDAAADGAEGAAAKRTEGGAAKDAGDAAAKRESAAPTAGASGESATAREPEHPAAHGAEAAPAKRGGVRPRPVRVPDLGDFDAVEIIDVLVAEGDEVEAEQGLISLETDKATMDVPSPEPGRVVSIKVAVGDRVSAGDEILTLEPSLASPDEEPEPAPTTVEETVERQERAARSEQPAEAEAPARERAAAAGRVAPIDEQAFSKAHASPSVRKLARELGVDLGRVRGSGRKGRVTADDVKRFVKEIIRGGAGARGGALPAVPAVDFAKFGAIEERPLRRIQRISSQRLHASWVNIPHVTQHDEADITALEETRQSLKEAAGERGIRLTPLAFIMRACVLTLEEFPHFKASLAPDGETLILKHYTHLGFAADTPSGLVVPVIRDADRKDVYELATALGNLSESARGGKLRPDDMQGGVFTVSSLGGIGGTFFTPIINAPEIAILGVSRSQWRPVWRDGEFVPRLMLPLSLSYDHRV